MDKGEAMTDFAMMSLKDMVELREKLLQDVILLPKDCGEWVIANENLKRVNLELAKRIIIDLLERL